MSAPAGFGKTVQVDTWLEAAREAAGRPFAWYTLDASDNDPAQFYHYLVAAFQQVDPAIGVTTGQLLQSPQLPATASLLTPLIIDLAARAPLSLVLDDYHAITTPPVHEAVRFLLDHLPQGVHVVITTREDPPFSLARLRVRDQVIEIRQRDLRFTIAEAAAFLNDVMRLDLALELVEQLMERTEGWVAALQLAALAMRESPNDAQDFVTEFTGDNRYVMDYLLSEVLERQPSDVRAFLKRTSVLDRLTAPLCDAVTGRADSRELLEWLAHANLFVIPLDSRHTWYRYHQMFAEVLRQMLEPGEAAGLHRRAAAWCEAAGSGADAIAHALAAAGAGPSACTAADFSNAARLIAAYAETYINDGRLATVLNWLNALPEAIVRASPDLAADKAWALAASGDIRSASDYLGTAQSSLGAQPSSAVGIKLGLAQVFTTLAGDDFAGTALHAQETLAKLPTQHPWRAVALWALAEAQERNAPIAEAVASWREARTAAAADRSMFLAVLDVSLAAALNVAGKRHEALSVCRQSLARYSDAAGHPGPLAVLILTRLVLLHYEANELDQAAECLRQGQALAGQIALDSVFAMLEGLSALLCAARGETSATLSHIQRAMQLAPPGNLSDVTWVSAIEGRVYLRHGDVAAAQQWADAAGLGVDAAPNYLLMEQHCTYARLLLAQGRLADAERWLAQLERFVVERSYVRWQITVRLLQAVAAECSSDSTRAGRRLVEALQLAAPEGYRRAFLDEDARVLAMLAQVRASPPTSQPDFVVALLQDAKAPAGGLRGLEGPSTL